MRARLIEDGYFTTPPEQQPAAAGALLASVREGMQRIVEAGWPATMILMYDEAWAIAHHLIARWAAGSLKAPAWSSL